MNFTPNKLPNAVDFFILNKQLIFPISATTSSGLNVAIDTVVLNLTKENLIKQLQERLNATPLEIDINTEEKINFYKNNDPILKATKLKSWKQLAQNALGYALIWYKDKVELYLHT